MLGWQKISLKNSFCSMTTKSNVYITWVERLWSHSAVLLLPDIMIWGRICWGGRATLPLISPGYHLLSERYSLLNCFVSIRYESAIHAFSTESSVQIFCKMDRGVFYAFTKLQYCILWASCRYLVSGLY